MAVVYSSSAISTYKRCPKSFEFGYVMNLQPADTVGKAVEDGSRFHNLLAQAALDGHMGHPGDEMGLVADEYLKHNPLPKNIVMVEEPMYTPFRFKDPKVYIRTTFDLVYEEDGVIIGRDYKTFEKAPTLDVDLDFQGRIYIAALMKHFPGRDVQFEYEYVRRVPPGTKNSKGHWTPQDCYLRIPLIISRREADQLWKETEWVVSDILYSETMRQFYRTDLKVGPHSCGSCFYRNICKADLEHGGLDEQDLQILAPTRREPITLPSNLNIPR